MSEQTDQRKALLRKWADLAPGECRADDCYHVFYRDVYRLFGPGKGILRDRNTALDEPMLLATLIEAIRARGWSLRMDLDATLCQVFVAPDSPVYEEFAANIEPSDAMLSAYVQALEATKEP